MLLARLFKLCFSLHFPLAQSPEVSQKCSQAFSKHDSNRGHACTPLDSLVYMELFKASILSCIFFPRLFLPKLLVYLLFALSVIPCTRRLCLVYFPLNAINKCCPGGCSITEKVPRWAKQRQAPSPVPQGTSRQVKPQNHNFLRAKSITLLVPVSHTRNMGCHSRGCHQAGE